MQYSLEKKSCPHSIFAEQIILTDLLLDTSNKELIFSRLIPEVFYVSEHKYIYEASVRLYSQGSIINLTTISETLAHSSLLETIGGTEFLVELVNRVIPTGNIEPYLVLLLDKYLRRSLIAVGSKIGFLAYEPSHSVETLFDQAEQLLSSVTHAKPKFGLLPASEVLLETFVELEQKYIHGSLSGISSGFFDLDLLTQGFQKSDLIIIAGRPSMGKTAFALNLARNIAELQLFPVTIFSLEMSRQQIMYRFLSIESQIVNSRLKAGNINSDEWNLVSKAISHLASLKIYVDDTPSSSLIDIRAKLTRLKSTTGQIGAVIIDYLQLITDSTYKNNRVQELSKITRNLKILAREFDTPVIVLSQLSRNVETRINKRPLLSDLRESGCISGRNKVYIPHIRNSKTLNSLRKSVHLPALGKSVGDHLVNFSQVKRFFFTGLKTLFNLSLINSYHLRLTLNHKVFTNKGWVKLHNLKKYDLVCVFDRFNLRKWTFLINPFKSSIYNSTSFNCILNVTFHGLDKAYDAWMPEVGNFICSDIIVHNSIEQDADVVLMIYRENYYSSSELKKDNITEIIIAKQRNGPIGTINLMFDNKLASFSNLILLE